MEIVDKTVNLEVSVNTEKAVDQTEKLIQLLKSASSLAGELADTLKNLELDIEEPCRDELEDVKEDSTSLRALEGIAYPEWVKLRIGMDRYFNQEKGESEKSLKLANTEIVERLIRSQFG